MDVIEALAVTIGLLGLYCFGKYLSVTFFLPRQIVTAVTVIDADSRENADILIHILKKGAWRMADRRICILVREEYLDDELIGMIENSGVEYYLVK